MVGVLSNPDSVRLAAPQDESALYDLLVSLHRDNRNGWGFGYRPEVVLRQIERGTRPDPDTRTESGDKARGLIGIIDGEGGRLIGSVGLFLDTAMWFTDAYCLVELWLFVRPESREHAQHERDLFEWAKDQHKRMKAGLPTGYPLPFPMLTGFQHQGKRFDAMERLWRMRSGGRKIGSLFMVD